MYVARFSYDVVPTDRQRALECINREVQAARDHGLVARLLVPVTRPHGGSALQFEVELEKLDQLPMLRHHGIEDSQTATAEWVHDLTDLLTCPPEVQIFRLAAMEHHSVRQSADKSGFAGAVRGGTHPAGPHARPEETDYAATAGTGALPDANQRTVEAGTG